MCSFFFSGTVTPFFLLQDNGDTLIQQPKLICMYAHDAFIYGTMKNSPPTLRCCVIWKACLLHGTLSSRYCDTLQYTATHWNTLHQTAPRCNTLQHTAAHWVSSAYLPQGMPSNWHCTILQHTGTHRNILQHTATYVRSLDHALNSCRLFDVPWIPAILINNL